MSGRTALLLLLLAFIGVLCGLYLGANIATFVVGS